MNPTGEMQKRLDDFCKAMSEVVKKMIEAMRPLINLFKKFVISISNYPNKRMVYLALYAKKERVRQKNRNRIINDWMKEW
jgi:hypothetical protein